MANQELFAIFKPAQLKSAPVSQLGQHQTSECERENQYFLRRTEEKMTKFMFSFSKKKAKRKKSYPRA